MSKLTVSEVVKITPISKVTLYCDLKNERFRLHQTVRIDVSLMFLIWKGCMVNSNTSADYFQNPSIA